VFASLYIGGWHLINLEDDVGNEISAGSVVLILVLGFVYVLPFLPVKKSQKRLDENTDDAGS
jgi:hypothetical protein